MTRPITTIAAGYTLRIVDREHFRIVYTFDNWATTNSAESHAVGYPGSFVDIPTAPEQDGSHHLYSGVARAGRAGTLAGQKYRVSCVAVAPPACTKCRHRGKCSDAGDCTRSPASTLLWIRPNYRDSASRNRVACLTEQRKRMSEQQDSKQNELDQLSINALRFLAVDAVAKGQLRPSRRAARLRADRLPAVPQADEARSVRPEVDRPRPLRPLERPRLGAALRRAASLRLRPADVAARAVPPVGLAHPGPSRVRRDAGRRSHDRPARPGLRHGGGHRDGREASRRGLQPRHLQHRRSLHLRSLRRRRPDGRHLARDGLAGRNPRPRQAHRPLRRQPDLARRPDRALATPKT